ncbi:MAG TPA: class I SAM-dependent methyltransferase [Candidatus Binataceae bacterium]|nr:class I SAM-dependent methyltransferase [Candidatus Binataceae bacterium]
MRSIYDFPQIFRAVHMEQPEEIAEEIAFIKKVWTRLLRRPVRRVLDVACGDSPHGLILARQKIKVVGIDRSPAMIAAGRAQARGIEGIKFYRRNIENFRIPESDCDAATCWSETLPVMTENASLITHLKSVARVLRPGGLYCVDVDRHDGVRPPSARERWRTRRVRVGSTEVEVREFRCAMPWHAGGWIYELNCAIKFPDGVVNTCDHIPVRYTLPNQLEFAAKASGVFELVACYTDLSFTTPIAKCYRRWLGVMRRR